MMLNKDDSQINGVHSNRVKKQEKLKQKLDKQVENQTNPQEDLATYYKKILQFIKKKEYYPLVKLVKNDPQRSMKYPKIRYNDEVYCLGDNVQVQGVGNEDYVGKLLKIYNIVDSKNNCLPLIKVQWYYRKQDLQQPMALDQSCISEHELFFTDDKDVILIESVLGRAEVISYEEYDTRTEVTNSVYFTRAQYSTRTKSFTPPFDQWKRTCLCQKPGNPDLQYILCENCQMWYHIQCVGLTEEGAAKQERYFCPKCR